MLGEVHVDFLLLFFLFEELTVEAEWLVICAAGGCSRTLLPLFSFSIAATLSIKVVIGRSLYPGHGFAAFCSQCSCLPLAQHPAPCRADRRGLFVLVVSACSAELHVASM